MNVDILINERDGSRGFYVPWLPDTIEYDSGGMVTASYDILNRGTVEIPTGTGLREVSWDGVFPGRERNDGEAMRRPTVSYREPAFYHSILEDWRTKGTVLNLAVFCYPINLNVIVAEYTASASGPFGDMEYSVRFREKRELTIWPLKPENKSTSEPDQAAEPKRVAETSNTYTIKTGDSLWSIAASQLGNGARYTEVYELNKDVLEKEAQKYGHHCTLSDPWIFAGTVISMPAK